MSISILSVLSGVALTAQAASAIEAAVKVYMAEAEVPGVTGAQKLAAVKDATDAFIKAEFPQYQTDFDAIWSAAVSLISGFVSLYHSLGIFKKVTPAVGA